MRLLSLSVLFAILISPAVFAKTDEHRWCGTGLARSLAHTNYTIAKHQRHKNEFKTASAAASVASATDIGEIAVIEGNDNVIIQPNRFDLGGKKITFRRRAGGRYALRVSNGTVSGDDGQAIDLGDDDSEQVDFTSGFSFPFFDARYNGVFINSDGNLTFTRKDDASSSRDTTRFLTGPPRIALLFTDLNPATGGEVKVLQTATRFRVTWLGVPEFGTQNRNTVQLTLTRSGKIDLVFERVDSQLNIVGISPGNSENVELVDYTQLPASGPKKSAFLERFSNGLDVDYVALIKEFHRTHPKIFDFVVIFTDFQYPHPGFAFYQPIRNNVQGIGLPNFDFGEFFDSPQIQGFLLMGNIGKYPNNPNQTFLGTNTTLDIFGQENGHRWLAFPRVNVNGQETTDLLGRDESHWAFAFDSDASVMEGNDIQDNGDGSFVTVDATSRFSKLDRYIMGLIPASQVGPFFFVQGAAVNAGAPPEIGRSFLGTRINLTIDNIIAAEGPRVPQTQNSQKQFREAFIFLTRSGPPAQADIQKLDQFRRSWVRYFRKNTGRRAKIDASLP